MSKQRRYALGLGAAALSGTVVVVILSGHLAGSGERAATDTRTTTHTAGAPKPSPSPRRRSWVAEANAVCRLGQKMYPSIAFGVDNGDPDTMGYAVNRLVDEIGAIPVSRAASARQRRLAQHGLAAGSAWGSLARRPVGEVTLRQQQEAERLAARYIDELVALGARACAPLRPAAS